MRTLPSGRSTDVWPFRSIEKVPADDHTFLEGSKSSALARRSVPEYPPLTRTRPSARVVAACPSRAFAMGCVAVQVDGNAKMSAVFVAAAPDFPPATSTVPSGRRLAMGSVRSMDMRPALDHEPATG